VRRANGSFGGGKRLGGTLRHWNIRKRRDGGTVQSRAIDRKMRSVARTVPAPFQRIPVDVTAEMGAHRRLEKELARVVAICRDFGQSIAHDGAASGLEIVKRAQLAGGDVLREILHGGDVLAYEFTSGLEGFARGIVGVGPRRAAGGDKLGQDEAANHAMSYALA